MAVSDYIGRTIDVLAFRGGTAVGEVELDRSLAADGGSGEITTGIQKLAQKWLLTLLTEKGSVKYKPNFGTFFMRKLAIGSVATEQQLFALFSAVEIDLAGQLLAEEDANTPDDERYNTSKIISATVFPGYINLTVTLSSQTSNVNFIVPIPLVV